MYRDLISSVEDTTTLLDFSTGHLLLERQFICLQAFLQSVSGT